MRQEVEHAFFEQPHFRQACLDMSREAMIGRARGISLMMEEVSEDMLNLAVEYVIAEMPFLLEHRIF